MSRVGIVSVHYYESHLKRSLASVHGLARRAGAHALIAVGNNPVLMPELLRQTSRFELPHVSCHLHDNRGLEFGAFQAGLEKMLPFDPDWVVFANDTYAIHQSFSSVFRKHLLAAVAMPSDGRGAEAAGQVESIGRSYSIRGMRSHRWLTTSIFALNRPALRALGNRVYFPEIDRLVNSTADVESFFAPELDPAIVAHISAWLFGPSPEHSWYGAEALNDRNAERLANKARSILQEKYLSAVLDNAATWFFDIKGTGIRDRVVKRLDAMLFAVRASLTPTRRRAESSAAPTAARKDIGAPV